MENRSHEQLVNDINMSFAKNYVSPFILKDATETSTQGDIPILNYIEWGLRARGVFDNQEALTKFKSPSILLRAAYELGLEDGRITFNQCSVGGVLNLFLMKKHTLLFLCEYGDEIIYSRLVLESGKQIDLRTVWILEACCPDLMHSEIRIFSNIRSKLFQCLVELQVGKDGVANKKIVINKATKAKIVALEAFQSEVLRRNSIDVARCLKIQF